MSFTKSTRSPKTSPTRPRGRSRKNLKALVEEYLIFHQSQNHSPKTIEWHKTALGYLVRYLEQESITDPGDFETSHLRGWIVWLGTPASSDLRAGRVNITPRSKRTVNTYARSAHAFCKWLLEEQHSAVDITDHLVLPKYGKPLIRVLEDDEFAKLLEACEDKQKPRAYTLRDQAILWLMLDTGMRLSEITELTYHQLDLRTGVLIAHGKGDKERRIALGSNALSFLRRYLDHARGEFRDSEISQRLFLGEVGPLTYRGVSQIILRCKRRAGLTDKRISPHIFRHTFAVRYLMLGGDPFSLQELLGHEDMATIRNYMHMNDVHIQMQKRKYSPGDHVTFSAKPRRRSDFRKS